MDHIPRFSGNFIGLLKYTLHIPSTKIQAAKAQAPKSRLFGRANTKSVQKWFHTVNVHFDTKRQKTIIMEFSSHASSHLVPPPRPSGSTCTSILANGNLITITSTAHNMQTCQGFNLHFQARGTRKVFGEPNCCSDAWFLVFHPQDIGLCFQILPSMAAYAAAATASAGKRRHRQVGQVFPFPFFSWHQISRTSDLTKAHRHLLGIQLDPVSLCFVLRSENAMKEHFDA